MKKLLLILLMFFLLVGSASAVDLSDLVYHYDFDENTGTTASDNVGSFDLTLSSSNAWYTNNCQIGSCVNSSTGKYYLQSSSNIDIIGSTARTIHYWVATDGTAPANSANWILFYGGDGTLVRFSPGGASFNATTRMFFGGVGNDPFLPNEYTTTLQHHAYVYDGTYFSFYVDGVLQYNQSWSLNTANSVLTLFDYRTPGGGFDYENAVVDELGIWNRSLSSSEILEIYNAESSGTAYPWSSLGNFTVTVTDGWSGADVDNITVALANGTTFTNSTGHIVELDVLLNESVLINFSVLANNGDYFNRSYVNYNLSSNLGATLNQSIVFFNASELFTNNSLSNVTFTISADTNNPKGLSTGNYTVTASKAGYFDKEYSFEVLPLDNKTITVTGMSDTLLNVTAVTIINGTSINSFSGYAYNDDLGINVSIDTNTSFYEASVLTGNYTLFLTAPSHANTFFNVTVDDQVENVTVPMYTNNSLNVSLYDIDTLSLIAVAANISFVGSSVQYNKTTSNGLSFIDYMNDDTYEVTVNALGYETSSLFVTVGRNTHDTIIFYLTQTATEVDFIVRGNNPSAATNLIENATLTFSRNINGTTVVVGQTTTDFSGRASIFLDPTVTYTLSVSASGFNSFTGTVKPTQSEYSVTLTRTISGFVESQFTDLVLTNPLFSYNNSTSQVVTNYTINSATGSLQYFGVTSTFDGNTYTQNITGSPGGGTPNINFSVNTSINSTVLVTYFYKLVNSSEESWSENYFVSDVNAQSSSLPGFINELASASGAVKGMVGAFIVVFFVVLFAITRNLSVITISGLIGVFINYQYGLWPNTLCLITLVVGIILLISDNVGGRG